MFGAPQPRFRIYTTPVSYLSLLPGRQLVSPIRKDAVEVFESSLRRSLDSHYSVAMPTARTAIYSVIKQVIEPGQKVILSPLTIVDVINMVILAGGVPVFCDLEENTCNMDASKIEALIEENTAAIMVTHLHGLACEMDTIMALCKKHSLTLIEDAAQAFGTRYNGKPVGTFGKAGIFSFGLYKNINSFNGGMVVTDDGDLATALRRAREQWPTVSRKAIIKRALFGLATDLATYPLLFKNFTYWVFRFMYLHKLRALDKFVKVDVEPKAKEKLPPTYLRQLSPLQATLADSQIDRVQPNNEARIRTAHLYDDGLKDIAQIIRPPRRDDGSHTYTYYAIRVPDREALMRFSYLNRRDLVLAHYHNNAHLKCFEKYNSDCPIAQATSQQLVYLPTYPRYPEAEARKNIEMLRKFYLESPL